MMNPQYSGGGGLEAYNYVFMISLAFMAVISVIVIIAAWKAKKDTEKQLKLIEKQTVLLEEIRNSLVETCKKSDTGVSQNKKSPQTE